MELLCCWVRQVSGVLSLWNADGGLVLMSCRVQRLGLAGHVGRFGGARQAGRNLLTDQHNRLSTGSWTHGLGHLGPQEGFSLRP